MTKVIVDINKLAEFSENLVKDAEEFDSILNNMVETINGIISGWQGLDAENFIANATAYIENLYIVRNAIVSSSDAVAKNVMGYVNRINSFYEKLGG